MDRQQLLEQAKRLCNENKFCEALTIAERAKTAGLHGFDGIIAAIRIHQQPKVTSQNKIDYYAALQLPKTASSEVIAKTYKKMSLLVHPDKLTGLIIAHEAMQTLSDLNSTLKNFRSSYDATLPPKPSTSAPTHSTPTPTPAAASTSSQPSPHHTPTPKQKVHYSAPPMKTPSSRKSYFGNAPSSPHFTSTSTAQPRPNASTSHHHYSAPPTSSPLFVPRSVRRKMKLDDNVAGPSKRHHK